MRLYLSKLILFIVFFTLINWIYLILLQNYNLEFVKRIESIKNDNSKINMAIFGNSYALDDFDSELISNELMPSYNFALGGATVRTSLLQLKELLKSRNGNLPKFIIYGIGPSLDQGNKIHPIVDYTQSPRRWSFQDLPLLRFNWLFYELLKLPISKNHRNSTIVYGQYRSPKISIDNSTNDSCESYLKPLLEDHHFLEFMKVCHIYNSHLIIVELPAVNSKRNYTRKTPKLSHYPNLLYLNMNQNTDYINSETDWLGGSHLNQFGAKKFTTIFNDSIKVNFEM